MPSPTSEAYALADAILAGEVELSPEYEEAISSLLFGEPFGEFMARVSPHLPPPRHTKPIADVLEACKLAPQRVCISMPPRHGKTVTLLHGLAWWLSRFPADTCAYYSYSDTQARSKSVIAHQIAKRAGVSIGGGKDATNEWRTPQGGGLLAGGRGSPLTGQGLQGLFVVDDPFKDREEADSALIRDKTWDWFTEVGFTRLEGASVIVTHTRWHEDDLIGRLAARGDWQIINLPAIAEHDDPIGRGVGEALWPTNPNLTLQHLRSIRSLIGEHSFAALYQGAPRPRGHRVFGEPTYYDPLRFDITGKQIMLCVDPALTEKTTADYSVLAVIAIEPEPHGHPELRRAWLLEIHRHQMTAPDFARLCLQVQRRFGMATIHVETVAGFKAIPQIMRDLSPGISVEDHDPTGDKFQRAQPVAQAWNEGRFLLPTTASWLKDFLREVKSFTGVGSKKDDQVDALSTGWNAYTPPVLYRRFATVGGGRRM